MNENRQDYALLEEVRATPFGSTLTAAASIGDTQLVVDYGGEFSDEGGTLDLNGARLTYTTVIDGTLPDDPDTIVLAAALTAAAGIGDTVAVVEGGQILQSYDAMVTMGEGDQIPVPLTVDQRAQWPVGVYDPPVPVIVADDMRHIEDAPGRTTLGRASAWDLDHTTATADATAVVLTLTYVPSPNSLQVKKRGIDLLPSEWSLVDNVVTMNPTTSLRIKAGDAFSAYYLYDEAAAAVTAAGNAAPPFAELMLDLGPAWWDRQGESAGPTAVDSSGNGHNGTTSAALGIAGLVAGDPDTASGWIAPNHLDVPYGSWMDAASISGFALFKTTSTDINGITILSRWDSVAGLWIFQHVNGNLVLKLNGTTVASTGLSLNNGSKHMAGFTYDGTTVKLYTEAGLVKSQAATATITGGAQLMVGADRSGGGGSLLHHFVGTLDETAIWSGSILAASDFNDLWMAAT